MYWWNVKYYTDYPFTETVMKVGKTELDVMLQTIEDKKIDRKDICATDKLQRVEDDV